MVKREFRAELTGDSVALAMMLVIAVGLVFAVPSFAGVHDPMRPQAEFVVADTVSPVKTEFNLEATMVSDQRRVAIINGSTVAVGDTYQGHCITSIDEGCVVLVQRGKKTSLTLQPIIKTRMNETSEAVHHIRGVD